MPVLSSNGPPTWISHARAANGVKLLIIAVLVAVVRSEGPTCSLGSESLHERPAVVAPRPVLREAAPPVLLRYKFQANQDVRLLLVVDAKIRVQKGDDVETSTNQAITERHCHVDSVDADGTAVLDLFIDNAKLSLSRNDSPPTVYDSKYNLVPPKEFQSVRNAIGKRLARVKVSARGRVLSLNDTDLGPADDPVQSFLDPLPESPVRVGEEWIDDVKVKVAVSQNLKERLTLRRRYKLESIQGNLAKIHLQTSEAIPITEPEVRVQLIQQTLEGTILFDIERGLIISRDLNCRRNEVGVMGEGSVVAATTVLKGSLR